LKELSKEFGNLKYIVQDQPKTIEEAKKVSFSVE